jgi:DNA mismatch repair protein MutL
MPQIRLLPDHLVSQIAAGEVVERPASVVKELVENALDAGATEITVELERGGKGRIRVADDGRGMDEDDALLAFDRHATSKIGSIEDLEQVGTLGFRGEALSSIAAVARVELLTAREPGDGHRVYIEGGRIRAAEPASRPRGTTVEVASLFFNVPARRKFLKTPHTEMRRALEVVQGYALARPDVHFRVSHEGRQLLEAPPAGEGHEGAQRRIGQLFGSSLAERLAPFSASRATAEGVWGLMGDPSTTRGRRYFVFVNRRLLRDRAILATFYRAVREEWRYDEFPALFLFLDLAPEEVDVNVHPQKSEVRFRDPRLLQRLFHVLREGARNALGDVPVVPGVPEHPPTGPLAWQGLGGRHEGFAATSAFEGVSEPGAVADGASGDQGDGPNAPPWTEARLAETVWAPIERAPVPLTGRSGRERPFRLLGQYKGTLILLEGPDGLYLIDQHVAHERILYERLSRSLARERSPSQALLEPLLLDLAPAEALRLGELGEALEACGYSVSVLSGETVAVSAVPADLDRDQAERLLSSLAQEEAPQDGEGAPDPEVLRARVLDALAASLACRAAVKMHEPMPPEAMEALIAELFAAEQPYACPHGRPIVLHMSDRDLEERFGRR